MATCKGCGTHTGTHWPDCPFGSQPHYSARLLKKAEEEFDDLKLDTIREVMEAQADLQVALGIFRLRAEHVDIRDKDLIESRMYRSLGRLHRLLTSLGKPMYDPERRPAAYSEGS